MLLFKKKFLPAIRAGAKTQTIRLWPVCRFRSGQRSYIPGAGHIRIQSVEPVALDELTIDDAERDGFASLAALREEIAAIYAAHAARPPQAYRVIFALLPRAECPPPRRLRTQSSRRTPPAPGGQR